MHIKYIPVKFQFNTKKAKRNIAKHGVSFEEAASCFDDSSGLDFNDEEHSDSEERFILLGRSKAGRVLVTIYTERNDEIRLISSREASIKEEEYYYERRV